MGDCVFCKIVAGEIPAHKIGENKDFIAFLGILPRFPGMTIVATKKHLGSYIYQSMDDKLLGDIHRFAKNVALAVDRTLGSMGCIQVMEGLEVDHAHLKLFPVYEGKPYGVSYEGSSKVSDEELTEVAAKIRRVVS